MAASAAAGWWAKLGKLFGSRRRGVGFALVSAIAAGGCASTGGSPRDPLEPLNRKIFQFNDTVDAAVTKPIAKAYDNYMPEVLKVHLRNLFSNVGDVFNVANNLLQGKPKDALSDTGRVVINTVFGFGGLVDIASDIGLPKHDEDFGQTFGRWGIGSGPYIVIPFLGPSTVRDGVGTGLFYWADPIGRLDNVRARNTLAVSRVIDTRAQLLAAEKVVGGVALDRYLFIRDAYLQRRRSLIYDGDPPELPEDSGANPYKDDDQDAGSAAAKDGAKSGAGEKSGGGSDDTAEQGKQTPAPKQPSGESK